jgi:mannose-1-phosphate guanylyltransferase/mannose-6-phosphate isomerase
VSASITPVILCGGSGTRLWPLSRDNYPKQLLALGRERTLVQQTLMRAAHVAGDTAIEIICGEEHRFQIAEQLRLLDGVSANIILEPVGRNTAPAIALAALRAAPETLLLVMPSDHVIDDVDRFGVAVEAGKALAQAGSLVTFGLVPDRAETGYGYIRSGEPLEGGFRIARFVEKPDRQTAEEFVASGAYLWNSGIFLFRADAYLAELSANEPTIVEDCREALAGLRADLDFLRLDESAFSRCKSVAVDRAVMERTARAAVVPLECDWCDLGSFESLWEFSRHRADGDGNVVTGDVYQRESRDNFIEAQHRLVAAVGVEGLTIVETADAVLVADRGRSQEVRTLVEQLSAEGRDEVVNHRRIYRPWGYYETIDVGDGFLVKHLQVNPQASLSLQYHEHRAEHWVVVAGTAHVRRGDDEFDLMANESTYIPLGSQHRLSNVGDAPLHLVEVQTGESLSEDDIVRLDDTYGRK